MLRHTPRVVAAAIVGAGALAGTLFVSSAHASTDQVPTSVAADCSVDVTSQLVSWVASVSDNSVLEFGTNKCYRIEGTLNLSNRTGLDFEGNGSTFRSFDPATDQRPIWQLNNSTGIILHNMSVIGSYSNGGTYTSTLEHSHAIDLRGTNVEISGVTMKDLGGDCVYFGLYGTSTRSSGSVHDSSCTGTSRNAVSVVAGNDVTVRNVSATSIGYIAFDVEPNVGAGFGARGVTFDHNTIGSYRLIAFSIVENEATSDIAFTNNVLTNRGLKITAGSVGGTVYRPTNVTVSGNSADIAQAPAAMNLDNVDGLSVTGNTVPLTSGTMAQVDASCNASVSGNSYPGGTSEVAFTNSPSSCPAPASTSPSPTATASPIATASPTETASPTPTTTTSSSPAGTATASPTSTGTASSMTTSTPTPSAMATSSSPASPDTYTDRLAKYGSQDYTFTTASSAPVSVSLTWGGGRRFSLYLADENGTRVGEVVKSLSPTTVTFTTTPGTYRVRVQYEDWPTRWYTLEIGHP